MEAGTALARLGINGNSLMDPSGALTAALGASAGLASPNLRGNSFSEGEKPAGS